MFKCMFTVEGLNFTKTEQLRKFVLVGYVQFILDERSQPLACNRLLRYKPFSVASAVAGPEVVHLGSTPSISGAVVRHAELGTDIGPVLVRVEMRYPMCSRHRVLSAPRQRKNEHTHTLTHTRSKSARWYWNALTVYLIVTGVRSRGRRVNAGGVAVKIFYLWLVRGPSSRKSVQNREWASEHGERYETSSRCFSKSVDRTCQEEESGV